MHRAIQVEIVGGEPQTVLGIPGFVFVAAAAVAAALIAAGIAIWRMKADLAHERRMRDRDDARDTLYASLDLIEEATESVADCHLAAKRVDAALEGGEPASEVERREDGLRQARKALSQILARMNSSFVRTQVRFESDRFGDALWVMQHDCETSRDLVGEERNRPMTEGDLEQLDAAWDRVTDGFAAFSALCYEWFTEKKTDPETRGQVEVYLRRADYD